MRRFLITSLLLCFAVPSLFAQGGFTTVTGTITDPNGLKYACGTISAQLVTAGGAGATLNGGGFTTQTSPVSLGCPTTSGTGAPGSFAMRLADSGVINPSNTTWQFTINMTPGIAPPAGTGPQSFTVTTAINCGTNTPATCTSNQIDISTLLSASARALSNVVGGVSGPAGTNTQIQVNNNGVFGANSNLTFGGANFTVKPAGNTNTEFVLDAAGAGFTLQSIASGNGIIATAGTLALSAAGGTTVSGQGLVIDGGGSPGITVGTAVVGNKLGFFGATPVVKPTVTATSPISALASLGLITDGTTNCASIASPAVCGSAGAGMFALPAAATSVTVNTTAVTANSEIFVFNDDSLGTRLGVTCNTGLDNVLISSRVPGTSFTVTGSAPVTNPNCYSYLIVN